MSENNKGIYKLTEIANVLIQFFIFLPIFFFYIFLFHKNIAKYNFFFSLTHQWLIFYAAGCQ